jgi:hypothetical protein
MDSHKEPVKVPTTREAFRLDYPSRENARGPGAAKRRDPAILALYGTLVVSDQLMTISRAIEAVQCGPSRVTVRYRQCAANTAAVSYSGAVNLRVNSIMIE